MLPEVTLRAVSRDDVDRVGWWLEDQELSSRWFGHYGCGDPVHRSYDPRHMLEASDWEWDRVFHDTHRLIFSIHSDEEEHIGECQLVLDDKGGADLSLMIGRKDLWHRGYGTSTVIMLLDKIFGDLGLERVWVSVPEDNTPATGLFEKLGFVREAVRELCQRPDGSAFNARILVMEAGAYRARQPVGERPYGSMRAVTITGLPGSDSEFIAEQVAGMLGSSFIDNEIPEKLRQRLQCTPGELEAFVTSHRSYWTRLLRGVVLPMEWSASYDAGYYVFRPDAKLDYEVLEEHITRKRYLEGLASVVRRFAADGDVVMHGRGCHLFLPSRAGALNVFVSASSGFREERVAASRGISLEEARGWLNREDREEVSIFKHLHGSDLLDMAQYDLVLNMDRLSFEEAAQLLVGALSVKTPGARLETGVGMPPAMSRA